MLDAVLVEFKDGTVTLKKKDGATSTCRLGTLSDADRQYVEAFAAGAGDLASSPGSEPSDSSAHGDGTAVGDESVRTEAREDASTRYRGTHLLPHHGADDRQGNRQNCRRVVQ